MQTSDYLTHYATELAAKIQTTFEPLQVRGDRTHLLPELLRTPMGAQYDAIVAISKAMQKGEKTVNLIGEPGTGKAQPLDSLVLTPTGFKRMGDMQIGDEVVDPDGGIAFVTGVFPQGEKPCVRVWFTDRTAVSCCEDHLWAYKTKNDFNRDRPYRVESISQIRKKIRVRGLETGDRQIRIPMMEACDLGPKELPLDPYVVGAFIGDGCCVVITPNLSTADVELVEEVRRRLPSGCAIRKIPSKKYEYSVVRDGTSRRNSFRKMLVELGMDVLSHQKKIPIQFLHTTVQNRIELLQGLLDTDGGVEGNCNICFSTTSNVLAWQVCWLVQSLGGVARWQRRREGVYKNGRGELRPAMRHFRISINLPRHIEPFRLSRKKNALWKRQDKYLPCRKMERVEDIGLQKCQCISVSSKRSLYVTDHFIVTHNTLMSMAAFHDLSKGRPYRVVIMSPPHLVDKWCREVIETIPGAKARVIERYTELVPLARNRIKSCGAEYFVVSQNMAKLGTAWAPAYVTDKRGRLHCATCHAIPKRIGDDGLEMELLTPEELTKSQYKCESCGEPLWSWVAQYDRWPVATYIAKKMRGLFDYAIIDEAHEESAEASACAIAMSKLVQSVRHVIPATGTLINGYAHSVMSLMWRTSPASLAAMGFEWGQATEFSRKYGRLEKTIKTKAKPESNKESRGSTGRTTVKVLPGVMPSLVGDHLIGKCVFVSLEDVSDNLPEFLPEVVGVPMDEQQTSAYRQLENHMAQAIQVAMQEKNTQLLTKLVQALICYTDYPSDYGDIGYQNSFGEYVHVCTPPDLGWGAIRPKEQALIDAVLDEAVQGRKCWIYVEQTQKRDIQPRIESLLKAQGLRVKVLKSNTVSTRDREKWMKENGPKCDAIVSHPQLTATGLDYFDKAKTYNFPTLIFYQCGLKISTLRQASRRAWRIGQDQPCKVKYLHYLETMQERYIHLMSAKLQAAESIDGKFSLDGLAALSESGESMGIALAKELLEAIRARDSSLTT